MLKFANIGDGAVFAFILHILIAYNEEIRMPATNSTMMPLGYPAPHFSLVEPLTHRILSLADVQGSKGTVVAFICNHCPYVVHILPELIRLARHWQSLGVSTVGISANDPVQYPEDAPERMAELAASLHLPFPYLFDESQEVAKAYMAACTPDLYLFDSDGSCVYRGRFDGSTPRNGVPATGHDLSAAVENLLQGRPTQEQIPSIGCSIKWKQ